MTPYYRVQKLLPSGEWFAWSTRLNSLGVAREHLEALNETGGTFRLVCCVFSEEVVEDEGVCEMCSSYESQHPNMWCQKAMVCDPVKEAFIPASEEGVSLIRALDLRAERIRRLQEALCECPHRDFFQADLHDETCPVYVIAEEQKREYEPRV